jgi:hypothetical protein
MKKAFTQSNYGWSLKGLMRCIKENNLKSNIVFSTETSAIVHVKSYADSQILGAESTWCISQHDVSWKQYVEDTNGVQLFFYCFNHSVTGDYSLYGATFKVSGNIVNTHCCFTRENNPIGKARGFKTDEEALCTVVEKDFGKGVFNELASIICDIYEKEIKPNAKPDKKEKNGFTELPFLQGIGDVDGGETYHDYLDNLYFANSDYYDTDFDTSDFPF